jgi:hypothetical protein
MSVDEKKAETIGLPLNIVVVMTPDDDFLEDYNNFDLDDSMTLVDAEPNFDSTWMMIGHHSIENPMEQLTMTLM